jgi:hypothetical protein
VVIYLIFNYVSGTGKLSVTQLEASDVNSDGKVTVVDAAQVFHYVKGYLSVLPYTPKGNGRLTIFSYPDKTEYSEGEQLDLTGLSIGMTYENGQTETSTDYSYTGYSTTPGVKIIVISCAGAKIAFTVTVYPADITSIEITKLPAKLTYIVGQSLDLTGLTVTAVTSAGNRITVTDYVVGGFESIAGTHTITISYQQKKATFNVTVKLAG